MIDQQQFQQAAKHYRSGRISLSEFQSLAASGIQTKTEKTEPAQKQDAAVSIKQGEPIEVLGEILEQLTSDQQSFLVTGVGETLGAQLSQNFAQGKFDAAAQTFTCISASADGAAEDDLAIVAVVEVEANFKTGHLAAIVASR